MYNIIFVATTTTTTTTSPDDNKTHMKKWMIIAISVGCAAAFGGSCLLYLTLPLIGYIFFLTAKKIRNCLQGKTELNDKVCLIPAVPLKKAPPTADDFI